MKYPTSIACAALALALGSAAYAEDYQLLKTKVEMLVDQAKELYDDSCRKDSETHNAPCKYYFGLMYATGTNVLARAETPTNAQRLRKYFDLIQKDYEAYTKVSAGADMAAATGRGKGESGGRHRAKRMINAEKLRDKELAAAVKRWEAFVQQLKRGAK